MQKYSHWQVRGNSALANGCFLYCDMNTFFKIAIGFVIGVVFSVGILLLFALFAQSKEDSYNKQNSQWFDLSTKNGVVTLHTGMPKDSVRILMGVPRTTDVTEIGNSRIVETWKYKGRNRYLDEFTFDFVNGELKSVNQYRE